MWIDTRQDYAEPVLAHAFHVWVDIHASMAEVFRFLTQEDGLGRWWSSRCHSDPRPGGAIHFTWETEKTITGEARFLRFEPPNLVVWEWTHHNGEPIDCNGQDPRAMRWPALNIFELALVGGGVTRLHLHDLGIGADPRLAHLRQATADGWLQSISRLKKVVEGHLLQQRTDSDKRPRTTKPKPDHTQQPTKP